MSDSDRNPGDGDHDLGDAVNPRRLMASARAAGAGAIASGRWLADAVVDIAPRIPIRDLATLRTHHGGLAGEALATEVIRSASRASAAIGAAAGALAGAEELAPPAWLALPLELAVETVGVAALEMKLIAELHEVFELPISGSAGDWATGLVRAWAERRGVTAGVRGAGTELARLVRRRLVRRLGRNLSTLAPLLLGAVAGAEVNRRATRDLGADVVADLASRQR